MATDTVILGEGGWPIPARPGRVTPFKPCTYLTSIAAHTGLSAVFQWTTHEFACTRLDDWSGHSFTLFANEH